MLLAAMRHDTKEAHRFPFAGVTRGMPLPLAQCQQIVPTAVAAWNVRPAPDSDRHAIGSLQVDSPPCP